MTGFLIEVSSGRNIAEKLQKCFPKSKCLPGSKLHFNAGPEETDTFPLRSGLLQHTMRLADGKTLDLSKDLIGGKISSRAIRNNHLLTFYFTFARQVVLSPASKHLHLELTKMEMPKSLVFQKGSDNGGKLVCVKHGAINSVSTINSTRRLDTQRHCTNFSPQSISKT